MNGEQSWFEVALIPETLERTTLKDLKAGDGVSIECDITAKTMVHVVEHYLGGAGFQPAS